MIKCEKGLAQFSGDALQISAETTTIIKGLMTTYGKNDGGNPKTKAFHGYLLKSIMYIFARDAHRLGYDTNFTEDDLESFDKIYRDIYEGDD